MANYSYTPGRERNASVEDGISIHQIFNTMLEKAWLIALCVLFFVGIAIFYVWKSDVLYTAHTVIQVDQQEQDVITSDGQKGEDLKTDTALKTYEQNLVTDNLFEKLISANNLQNDPTFYPRTQGQKPGMSQLLRILENRVDAKARRGTRLIDIWVDDTDPNRAQVLANSLVEQFGIMNFQLRSGSDSQARDFLEKEKARLAAQLEASDKALQAYKSQNNAISLSDKQDITVQKLKEISQQYTEAQAATSKLEADLAAVQRSPNDYNQLLAIPSISTAQDVLDVKRKIVDQQTLIASLKNRYKPKHPKYIEAQSQLNSLQAELQRTVLKVAETFTNQLDTARDNENRLKESLQNQEKVAQDLNQLSVRYNVLQRQVDADQKLYDEVVKQLNQTTVTTAFEGTSFRPVQPAMKPTFQSWPKTKLIITLAVVVGFLLGFALTFLISTADTTLRTVDQVEQVTMMSAIGAIPLMERSRKAADKQPSKLKILIRSFLPFLGRSADPDRTLVLLKQPASAVSESFRTLRTNLALEINGSESQSILFTSAIPAEGKTFCSSNYAVSLAQMSLRTLIVDCDLRRPAVAKAFNIVNDDQPGLGQYLQGSAKWEEILRKSEIANLDIITVGKLLTNPAETLASQAMQDFIAFAKSKYDRVILDTAPVNAVSDTLLFASQANTVCLVIKAASTPRRAVQRAVQVLKQAKANFAGVILNQLPIHSGLGYYYYYSSGSYGEGVYGAGSAKSS
jgi:capsular exopolysaccharide synthesis family protein